MATHYPNGLADTLVGDLFYNAAVLNPRRYYTYFNDFHAYAAGDWTITKTEAGAGSAAHALIDGAGGQFKITNDAADDDNVFFQKVGEGFKWVSGKDMFYAIRLQISDATEADAVFGLQITDTTPLDVTDGFFFIKADGAATVSFRAEKNDTASAVAAGSFVAATFVEFGFAYSAKDQELTVFKDNVQVGKLAVTANFCDDEELTISFGLQNGEAVIKTMTIDYIFAAVER